MVWAEESAGGVSVTGRGTRCVRPTGSDLAPRWRGRLHLGATVAALPAAAVLVARRPSLAVAGYAAGLVALFSISAAYHLLPVGETGRRVLRRMDHAAIYVFIALAYVPFCLRVVPGTLGRVVLGLALAGGLAGAVLKLVGFARSALAGAVLYMALGWMAVVGLPAAVRVLAPTDLALLAATGAFYTAGAATLATRWPDPRPASFGYHEVWHACVIVASACYFVVVWHIAGPR